MFISAHILTIFLLSLNAYAQKQSNRSVSSINDEQQLRITKSTYINDYKYFDNIVEGSTPAATSSVESSDSHNKRKYDVEKYTEIKNLLGQLLQKIRDVEKEKRMQPRESGSQEHVANVTSATELMLKLSAATTSPTLINEPKLKKEDSSGSGAASGDKQRWGHWTDWSSCSVSCGKGREIRWRHCLQNCHEAETEMEEKTCQLPACSPGKLFGFKLR